ncbi:hypothetical protein SAMN05192534_107119 [Alteribacillus persepolensis]|uniref:Uncharacterized protein n=2 Tax=Alteribacillus persepolensis TaxID=568899 RepID=A0A1G8DJX7_9BACI|nr:hypothetical protein SAMN05192534_107119 [Alteribacillus persepolensis]
MNKNMWTSLAVAGVTSWAFGLATRKKRQRSAVENFWRASQKSMKNARKKWNKAW